jgi:hypothetical protein
MSMRYVGLFLALGLTVATVSSAYAECSYHEKTASAAASGDASQAKLKRSEAGSEG